ncbi:MAG TPA: sialidase family protein [Gemmatimonadaceae bacterium]|nr:sialidase family protein [Gemmatimonadaceae bacterium]
MVSLSSPTGAGAGEPFLSAQGDRVYLSWLEPVDSAHALKFAALDDTTWSAPRTIRSGRDFFVNWADFPSLKVLRDGRLAAHWLQKTGVGTYAYGVRVSQSTDGGATWSEALIPHRDSSDTEHGFVTLWQEGNGLNAVWLDGRKYNAAGHSPTNEMMVVTTTIGADGTLGAETRLDERACDCCQTAVAVSSKGPVVAYRDRTADEIRDIYVVRRVGGQWTAPVAVHADNWKIAACPVNGPAVAAEGERVALAWFTAATDSGRVNLAFSDDAGATFGAPVRIDDGRPAGRVDVVMLRDGGALVSWIERTGGDTAAVRVRHVSRDGRPAAPVTIATSSAKRASGFPRMVMRGDEAIFAWTEPGSPSVIRVAKMSNPDK